MMAKELFTGAQLLKDQRRDQLFGMVGAFGPPNDIGTVRLTLDCRYVTCEEDDESVTIDLPEPWARQLAEQLVTVTVRLEHLRALVRLGRLTPDALLNGTELEKWDQASVVKQQQSLEDSSDG